MKLIVGLGNPGREYDRTRHNVGWWAIDHLADVWHFDPWKRDGKAVSTTSRLDGRLVRLLKPQTFMNLSGEALHTYAGKPFWSPATDLLVIVDEVALPLGTMRLRAKGSAGGHNGLKSVEATLGTQGYARLRIGIRPDDERRIGDLADFVLHPASAVEREVITGLFPRMVEVVNLWLKDGAVAAANLCNRKDNDEAVGG
jgi:PTH1 family peptidyl-tRNA hydrolase